MGRTYRGSTFFWVLGRTVLLDKIRKVLGFNSAEGLPLVLDVLEGFNDGFGHSFVGVLRTPNDGKLLGLSDSFMAVVVV